MSTPLAAVSGRLRWPLGLLAIAVVCAARVAAQPGADDLRERIERRFDVLVARDAISLRPRSDSTTVRWMEVTDEAITVNGEPVTGQELRSLLGDDADLILQLSYLDDDDRRDLFEDQDQPDPSGRSRVGGRVHVGRTITVERDEVVTRDVVAIGGSVRVFGEVRGSVVSIGGGIELGPNAVVGDDLVIIGTGELRADPTARIAGEVHEVRLGGININDWTDWQARRGRGSLWPARFGPALAFASTMGRLAILSLFALVVVLLGRDYVERIGRQAADAPLKAGAVGVLAQLLFVPLLVITIVVLVITIIGIPLLVLIPFVLLGLAVVGLVGFTAVALRIGRLFGNRVGWTAAGPYALTLIGIVVVLSPMLVARLVGLAGGGVFPMTFGLGLIGAIAEYLVWTVGFGAVALARFSGQRHASTVAAG